MLLYCFNFSPVSSCLPMVECLCELYWPLKQSCVVDCMVKISLNKFGQWQRFFSHSETHLYKRRERKLENKNVEQEKIEIKICCRTNTINGPNLALEWLPIQKPMPNPPCHFCPSPNPADATLVQQMHITKGCEAWKQWEIHYIFLPPSVHDNHHN